MAGDREREKSKYDLREHNTPDGYNNTKATKITTLSTTLLMNTTKKSAHNTNLTPTRCRPTADAAHVLAMDPVFPGIYKVQ
jgi:hypothetical protein